MADVVLVHGAFRGGWAWNRVIPRLTALGHRAVAADLTAPDATLGSYIADLGSIIERHELQRATLVGHSQGGFIIRAASQFLAAHLRQLVYLDAPVPANGQCAFDVRPSGSDAPAVTHDQIIEPRLLAAGEGLSEADAAWINARLVAQPVAPSMEPITLDDPAALALPETFVFFSHTPPDFPCQVTRAALGAEGRPYHLLDGPHDAIVSRPDAVAELLLGLLSPSGEDL